MKTSGEILLEEVKAEYSRQLEAWTELTQKSHTFLHLNGLLLTVIFIGIGLQGPLRELYVLLLAASSVCIIISIMIGIKTTKSEAVKEIKVKLEEDSDIEGKEREIIYQLIRTYNTAQDDIISKYNVRKKNLDWSKYMLALGLGLLLWFMLWFLSVNLLFNVS